MSAQPHFHNRRLRTGLKLQQPTGVWTNDFAYDKIGQLKVADSTVNTEDRGYLYDAAWNLNRRTNGPSALFNVDEKSGANLPTHCKGSISISF